MSDDRTVVSSRRTFHPWWIIVILVVAILAILGFAYAHAHPGLFGKKATATPRIVTATALPVTATPKAGPTGTPKPGPTGTPRPGPTATSLAAAVKTGTIGHPRASLLSLQGQVNSGDAAVAYYTNPVAVVQHNLPMYGFKAGQYTIKSPPASPTPTPYTGQVNNRPLVKAVVAYAGKDFDVFVTQPVQRGPHGIWVIITIRACSGASC